MMIIASIGLNYYQPDKLRKIILSGADALRYSFSQGDIKENIANIKAGVEIIENLHSTAKIIISLPSNKLKVGGDTKPIIVEENDKVVISSKKDEVIPELENYKKIIVVADNLGKKVYNNQIITVDHGKIALKIEDIINEDTATAQVLNSGTIQSSHTFNIAQDPDPSIYVEKLRKAIQEIKILDVDYISVPFINLEINQQIDKILEEENIKSKMMIRIEDQNGIDNIEEICNNSYYGRIIINRGELGDNIPFEKLGIVQKELTKKIKQHGKIVIIASQVLEGTVNNYIPLRSGILDLTNMVLDGVDGIMFTSETALGMRPAYAIATAKKIIIETQKMMR